MLAVRPSACERQICYVAGVVDGLPSEMDGVEVAASGRPLALPLSPNGAALNGCLAAGDYPGELGPPRWGLRLQLRPRTRGCAAKRRSTPGWFRVTPLGLGAVVTRAARVRVHPARRRA